MFIASMDGSGKKELKSSHYLVFFSQFSKKTFSVIDGSGELKGIRFAGFKAELDESDLFEFVCLDLKQVKAGEN